DAGLGGRAAGVGRSLPAGAVQRCLCGGGVARGAQRGSRQAGGGCAGHADPGAGDPEPAACARAAGYLHRCR
ncbi:hypothetical protein ACFSKU_21910, partial [Pontibacter silvestris]